MTFKDKSYDSKNQLHNSPNFATEDKGADLNLKYNEKIDGPDSMSNIGAGDDK